jgi:hypothetical protein
MPTYLEAVGYYRYGAGGIKSSAANAQQYSGLSTTTRATSA